jgi:hypothetical protein
MSMNSSEADEREYLMRELKYSLQALALPAAVQLELYPDGAAKADELALDFDHFQLCVRDNYGGDLSERQRRLLDRLDQELEEMSGAQNASLWTEEALRKAPEWEHIRVLAKEALESFGWEVNPPPPR